MKMIGEDHPVVGGAIVEPIDCDTMRMGPCGWDGKFFEIAKQPKT
jgi:hypothetical protein